MERHIRDQLQDGGWDKAFNDFLNDFVTYPAAFIKGPVVRRKKMLKWGKNFKPQVVTRSAPRFLPRLAVRRCSRRAKRRGAGRLLLCERVRFSIRDLPG
jgi:hypothetical protein